MNHDPDRLRRYAELIVSFGANVQRGQIVAVSSEPGKEPLARAIAQAAYRAGASFVDVASFDLHVKRASSRATRSFSRSYPPGTASGCSPSVRSAVPGSG